MDLAALGLHHWLDEASDAELDQLPFGVIGMDRDGRACRYNQYEVRMARFEPAEVIGRKFFEEIGRCMDWHGRRTLCTGRTACGRARLGD